MYCFINLNAASMWYVVWGPTISFECNGGGVTPCVVWRKLKILKYIPIKLIIVTTLHN